MPIFMDRHDVSENVTAAHVAQLHQQDLKIQDQFGCRGLTYWFDEDRKMAFCLIEAPSKKNIIAMHNTAHGEVPNQIIEVNAQVVESFLGRIKDPEQEEGDRLTIIDDSAFRFIMAVGFIIGEVGDRYGPLEERGLLTCMQTLGGSIANFDGIIASQEKDYFLVSFQSVSQAVLCALELYAKFETWAEHAPCDRGHLKIGISAGVPVEGERPFFEDVIELTRNLFFIASERIVVSHEIKRLYKQESLNTFVDESLFLVLSPTEEKFLTLLMNYMEEAWQNPNLQVEDLGKNLGYSKSQLYRNIVRLTGMSPNAFIKNYRLNQAIDKIGKQAGQIAEIAYETGFNSPSYFAKCFHERYGMSPSEYQHRSIF